jgi:hypothetical protein
LRIGWVMFVPWAKWGIEPQYAKRLLETGAIYPAPAAWHTVAVIDRRPACASAIVVALAVAAAACRGSGPTPSPTDPPPPLGSRPTAGGSDARIRTPRPLTAASLDALAAVALPGHEARVVARGAADLALAITAADGTRAIVTASGCLGCVAPELAAWQARRPSLAALWAPGAESEPPMNEARLAIASIDLGRGDHAIAIDARRADGTAVAIAHWNDGATQLQASCEQAAPPAEPPSPCAALVGAALAAALAALPP